MITYPHNPPRVPRVRDFQMKPVTQVGLQESPFTLEQEVQKNDGQIWAAEVTLPPMYKVEAARWIAWRLALNGPEGTFLMGDPDFVKPMGYPTGTPVLNGTQNARSKELTVRGFDAGSQGNLLAGDVIQLGSDADARLHRVLSDVNADAQGEATIDIWPVLRKDRLDGDSITWHRPVGLWRMAENVMPWKSDKTGIFRISFTCVEVV